MSNIKFNKKQQKIYYQLVFIRLGLFLTAILMTETNKWLSFSILFLWHFFPTLLFWILKRIKKLNPRKAFAIGGLFYFLIDFSEIMAIFLGFNVLATTIMQGIAIHPEFKYIALFSLLGSYMISLIITYLLITVSRNK